MYCLWYQLPPFILCPFIPLFVSFFLCPLLPSSPSIPVSPARVFICPAHGKVPNKVERIRGEKAALLPARVSLSFSVSLCFPLFLTVDIFQLMHSWSCRLSRKTAIVTTGILKNTETDVGASYEQNHTNYWLLLPPSYPEDYSLLWFVPAV